MLNPNQVVEREDDTLNIDMANVREHDPDLYSKLVRYPLDIIPILDGICTDLAVHYQLTFEKSIEVRFLGIFFSCYQYCSLGMERKMLCWEKYFFGG